MIQNYPVYAVASLAYAVFYTFCLYQNRAGITFPVFTAGTIWYFYFCLKRLGETLKKDSLIYIVSIELLGISTCLTGDYRIIEMNRIAIFLLLISFLLHICYEDRTWNFSKYAGTILTTIVMTLGCIARPVTDLELYRKGRKEGTAKVQKTLLKSVLLGLLICIPLVLVVLILLANSDAVFASIFQTIFENISLGEGFWTVFKLVLLTICIFFLSYMLVAYLEEKNLNQTKTEKPLAEPAIAVTVAAVLSVIYFVFCGIQIVYLFVGGASGALTLPDGITYSAYARSGFFQLLFVCILNLAMVLIGIYRFAENRILKVLLYFITACTYIMIASSAFRMILYIQFQYLTFLRIFVLFALFVIAVVMLGVLICIRNKAFPLFRYSIIVVTVCYLIFSFSRPDYFIAKVNIDNMQKSTQYDFFADSPVYKDKEFLAYNLGADAAPVMLSQEALSAYQEDKEDYLNYNVEKEWRSIYIARMKTEADNMSWRSWNLSLAIVKSELKNL